MSAIAQDLAHARLLERLAPAMRAAGRASCTSSSVRYTPTTKPWQNPTAAEEVASVGATAQP